MPDCSIGKFSITFFSLLWCYVIVIYLNSNFVSSLYKFIKYATHHIAPLGKRYGSVQYHMTIFGVVHQKLPQLIQNITTFYGILP